MAFATVAATNGGQDGTSQTSHTVNLPGSIAAGNLLIVIIAFDGNPTITWPSGWDQAANAIFDVASGTACRMAGRQRVADGSEGGSITVTTSVGEAKAYVTMRITGHHASTAVEAGTATNTTKPDPPDFNPTGWGTEDTLWLACGCTDAGGADSDNISAVPTNYTLVDSLRNCGTDAGGVNCGVGRRDLNAANENPGQFTTATNEDTVGATVAVRPAAAFAATDVVAALAPRLPPPREPNTVVASGMTPPNRIV